MNEKDFFKALFESLGEDGQKALHDMFLSRMDNDVRPENRTRMRSVLGENEDALSSYNNACAIYDANIEVVQMLGIIKRMLSSFNEDDLSMSKAMDNIVLTKHLAMLLNLGISHLKETLGARNED
jgi:hypothetical protein